MAESGKRTCFWRLSLIFKTLYISFPLTWSDARKLSKSALAGKHRDAHIQHPLRREWMDGFVFCPVSFGSSSSATLPTRHIPESRTAANVNTYLTRLRIPKRSQINMDMALFMSIGGLKCGRCAFTLAKLEDLIFMVCWFRIFKLVLARGLIIFFIILLIISFFHVHLVW